jgi:uroporphyrinogen-III synthase
MTGLPRPAVIHTGPADRSQRWRAALEDAGFEVRELPAIASEPVEIDAATAARIAAGAPYGLVVITSPRAAAALERCAAWIEGARIAAVGAATAKAAADLGHPVAWVGGGARRTFLESLAGRVDLTAAAVLHPHGDLTQDPGLPELAGRGARVVAPVVYRTVAVTHAPDRVRSAAAGAAGVTLTSPSGVRALCEAGDAAGVGREIRLLFAATLGPSTESAARKAGFAWRGVSARAEPGALAHLLATALKP